MNGSPANLVSTRCLFLRLLTGATSGISVTGSGRTRFTARVTGTVTVRVMVIVTVTVRVMVIVRVTVRVMVIVRVTVRIRTGITVRED